MRKSQPPGHSNAKTLYLNYRARAARRKIPFEITFEDFLKITSQDCYLCGVPPQQIKSAKGRNGAYVYNGIDRVDNKRGYEHGNVEACCGTCNFLKGNLSLAEFHSAILRILERLEAL